MEIINIKIQDLKPYENNPRDNDKAVEYVKNSISEFGFKVPMVIDKNNVIVCGHTRFKAAVALGLTEVPCVIADDLTEEQIKAFRLADNKTAEFATWDLDMMFEEINGIEEIDMDQFGFDIPEEDPEVEEDDYIPEIPTEPKSKLGQIYKLGRHRLMCGDSTKPNDVKKLLGGVVCDIEFTSPPYNVGNSARLSGNTSMTECKYEDGNDDAEDYDRILYMSTENALNNCKWTFINLQMLANNKTDLIDFIESNKEYLNDVAIWDKGFGAPAMAERVMNSAFEFIFCFSKYNNSRAIGTKSFRGTVPNIFECSPQRNNDYSDIHSATFPMAVPTHFIENFTNENDKVLDLFGGTGTTLIACEQLNRSCYMMEIYPKYVDVIIDRWEKFTGGKAELINDEKGMEIQN